MPERRLVKISRWRLHRPSTNSGKEYSMLPGTSRLNAKNYETSQRDSLGLITPQELLSLAHPANVDTCCVLFQEPFLEGESGSSSYIFQWSSTSFPLGLPTISAPSLEKRKLGQPGASRGRTKGGKLRSGNKWDTP